MVTKCTLCALNECAYQQVSTSGCCSPEECELLIIGDYPKADDDITGYPFSGDQYKFLWELLGQVGVKYQVTYLLRCIPIDKYSRRYRKPDIYEYETCIKSRLYEEINTLQPKCVLVLGQAALEAFLHYTNTGGEGSKVNIGDYRERARSVKIGSHNTKFLATYHPSYVMNSDNEMFYNRFVEDVVYSCRHAMEGRHEGKYKSMTITPQQFKRIADIWIDDPSIEYVSFDSETNGLNPWVVGSKITSFSLSVDGLTGYNVFCYHPELDISDEEREDIRSTAEKLLTTKKVVAHHAKHEHRYVKTCWGFTPNITEDTMYMSYILFLGYPGIKHGLKYLSGRFISLPPWEEKIDRYVDLYKTMKRSKNIDDDKIYKWQEDFKDLDFTKEEAYVWFSILKDSDYYIRQEESATDDVFMWMIPVRVMEKYGGMDAIAPLQLMKVFKPMIASDSGLTESYNMMVKGAEAFANIELKGLRIEDIDRWTNIYQARIDEDLEKLRNFAEVKNFELEKGVEFNPASSQHAQDVLFNRFRFPVKGTTSKGAPSAGESTLIDLIKEYREKEDPESKRKTEFLNAFRDYKKLNKLMSAYLVGLRKFIHCNDALDGFSCQRVPVPEGREEMHIHPGYILHEVQTGRVASREPSLHTIPAGSDIKRLFVSHWYKRGGLIVTADQSQLELRVLASIIEKYYGDSSLAQAYREGRDIHRFNASKVFARPEEDIVDSERRFAKTISFSLLYGSSEHSVAESTGRTADEVHNLFETFYEAFPGIKKYIEASHQYVSTYGCVRTPMGRVKYLLSALNPNDRGNYSAALRQAQNGIIQSSGSDMSFASIVYMNDYFREHSLDTKIVGFIHDSLELDAPPGEWFAAYDILKYSMKDLNEARDWVTAPLGIDVELGTSMGDTVAVKDMEVLDDGSRVFILKGYDYIIEDIIEESSYGYDILSDEILEEEEFFNRAGDLVARRALNLSFDDKTFNLQTRKIHWKPKLSTNDSIHQFKS